MKTQIIHLDSHDDIVSARDKMEWSQTARILLVWPDDGRILTRRIDLVLLQRHSLALGAQLALVTDDPQVSDNATDLGIPIYKDLVVAQKSHWRLDRRRRTSRSKLFSLPTSAETPQDLRSIREEINPSSPSFLHFPAVRLGLFTLGVLALLSIAALLIPSADIIVSPQTISQEVDLSITASPEIEKINISGVIPSRPVTVIVEGLDQIPASGNTEYPDRYAIGQVKFTNLTEEPVIVPVGTIVQNIGSNPVRFRTTQAGKLEPGPGTRLSIPVQALQSGSEGNLTDKSSLAVEGPLGLFVSASNDFPILGGRNVTVPAPTSEDQEELFQRMVANLSKTALEELQATIPTQDILFPSTLSLKSVLDEEYTPANVQPADHLSANLILEYQAYTITDDDLRELATQVLDANIDAGYIPIMDTLEIEQTGSTVVDADKNIQWKIKARRLLKAKMADQSMVTLTLGLTPTEAIQRVTASFSLDEPPHISLTPDWWPRMPLLPFRISVKENPFLIQ